MEKKNHFLSALNKMQRFLCHYNCILFFLDGNNSQYNCCFLYAFEQMLQDIHKFALNCTYEHGTTCCINIYINSHYSIAFWCWQLDILTNAFTFFIQRSKTEKKRKAKTAINRRTSLQNLLFYINKINARAE